MTFLMVAISEVIAKSSARKSRMRCQLRTFPKAISDSFRKRSEIIAFAKCVHKMPYAYQMFSMYD